MSDLEFYQIKTFNIQCLTRLFNIIQFSDYYAQRTRANR